MLRDSCHSRPTDLDTPDNPDWNEFLSTNGSLAVIFSVNGPIYPRHSMGLPYMLTLTPQTTPTDRHIWHTTWSIWVFDIDLTPPPQKDFQTYQLIGKIFHPWHEFFRFQRGPPTPPLVHVQLPQARGVWLGHRSTTSFSMRHGWFLFFVVAEIASIFVDRG